MPWVYRRFAARASGLAFGLALAVRPAGLAEAPGSTARRRRVPRSGMRSTVEAGGASPDNARHRSGPVGCDILTATGVLGAMISAWPWCWRARQRDTAGTASGRSPGILCAAARRAVGLASEGRGESCRPATARPRVNPGRLLRVTLAVHSLSTARACPRHSRPGRRARRAEGAPLKP
jgi:hypothetical protein